MSQQIAVGQCSTEEDLDIEWVFASGYDPTGRALEVNVRDRSSAIVKTTLTIGSGLTVAGASVKAKVSKAAMAAWARTEYSADLVDKTGGAFKRLVPTRITFDEPGKLVGGVKGSSFQIVMASNQVIVAAVGGVGLQGLKGDKGDKGDTGVPGAGAPSSPDILAIAERDDLLRGLAAAGVPDAPGLILDFVRGVHFASKAAVAASILTLIVAIGGVSTFVRGSTATYFDSDGLMKTAAINVPRIDYDPVSRVCLGYLREPSRTNLALSNNFVVSGTPTPTWVTDASIPAPDGSVADEVLVSGAWDTTNAAGNRPNMKATATVEAGKTYAVTTYVRKKPGGASGVRMRAFMPVGDASVLTFTVDDTNQQFASGWHRLSGTFTPTASGTMNIRIGTLLSDDAPFYCWKRGLQIEEGSTPSSLIFASASTVTRSSESLNVGTAPGLNLAEGTMFDEFEAVTPPTGNEFAANLGTGSLSDFIAIYRNANGNGYARSQSGSVSQISSTTNMAWPASASARWALGWKANDAAWAWEGALAGSNGAYVVPLSMPYLVLSSTGNINSVRLRRVMIFPRRLSNTKLLTLSNPATVI